jgi:hypothetical protein
MNAYYATAPTGGDKLRSHKACGRPLCAAQSRAKEGKSHMDVNGVSDKLCPWTPRLAARFGRSLKALGLQPLICR